MRVLLLLPLLLTWTLVACGSQPQPAPDAGLDAGLPHGSEDGGTVVDPGPPALRIETATESDAEAIVYGDRFGVVIHGLEPSTLLWLRTHRRDHVSDAFIWESLALYVSDAEGVVDTRTSASIDGTYLGVDADGPVWSMQRVSNENPAPLDYYVLSFRAEDEHGDLLASGALRQLATAPGVRRVEVRENGLFGVLYLPPDEPTRSPVIAFGGSEGGLFAGDWYASALASQGFPTLGLAYFGEEGLPAELKDVPLEYFGKAIDYLEAHPELDTSKLAVMGGSRGGELALLLGAHFPEVTAVVAVAPSAYVWGGVSAQTSHAWTLAGVGLPAVPQSPAAQASYVTSPDGTLAVALTPFFLTSMEDASEGVLEAARIPVEDIEGPILLLGGEDDLLWPSCTFQEVIMERLEDAGRLQQYDSISHCFPEAGHNISFVGGITTGSMWQRIGFDLYAYGGTAAGIARAQRQADDAVRAFLEEHLQ